MHGLIDFNGRCFARASSKLTSELPDPQAIGRMQLFHQERATRVPDRVDLEQRRRGQQYLWKTIVL
jgi:hypothetical protein